MKTYTCSTCNNPFEAEPIPHPFKPGAEWMVHKYCDPCVEAFHAKEAADKLAREQAAIERAWNDICPPLYRSTDISDARLSRPVAVALMEYNPKTSQGKGIGIIGKTGAGKTRISYFRLRMLHLEGLKVFAATSKQLERAFQDALSFDDDAKHEARKLIKSARLSDVLLLDDVGKEKFTERVASDFYELIEHRTAHMLPIIWTANATAAEIKTRMGAEHGEPTIRRLIEFSTIIEA